MGSEMRGKKNVRGMSFLSEWRTIFRTANRKDEFWRLNQCGLPTGDEMRNRSLIVCSTLLVIAAAFAAHAFTQADKTKRASPPAKTEWKFADGKKITVEYSSPRMKGRKIYGGLVPFGEVWRAGANEATTFVTDTNIDVGGKAVAAGSYTLFVIPEQNKWTLIVSNKTGEWGIPYPGESSDLMRADMKVSTLPAPVENFTIAFDKGATGCILRMDWETTRAYIEISKQK
jgi:hypothetical protein